jgi:hypothetical protein
MVARCLATDPARRFASVDEIATRLPSMANRWRALARGKTSAVDAVIAMALVALVLLALRPSASRDATRSAEAPAPSAPRFETTIPPPPTAIAVTSASPVPPPSSSPRVRPPSKPRGPAAPSTTARRDSTPTENRDELFAPRTVRPRHPDDVIDPFENQP